MLFNNIKISMTSKYSYLFAGMGAFSIWGLLVLFWYPLRELHATQILSYRIIFSVLTLIPIAYFCHKFKAIRLAISSRKILGYLCLSSLLIGLNWYLYIWAVVGGKIIEVGMGYYIVPLLNVLLGAIIFKERLTKLQILALLIASAGILWSIVAYGKFPYLSLIIAIDFALYGLIRKTIDVDSLSGLFIETAILLPLALIWLILNYSQLEFHFLTLDTNLQLIIMSSGFVTSLPLLLFAFASKGLKLSTMGIIQYISPSLNFLLGIFVIGEKISINTLITFICIWIALALYTYCALRTINTHSRIMKKYQPK